MFTYNFKKEFAQAVSDGGKIQTVRAFRKSRHAVKGDRIQLYTGMGTKSCRKLVTPDPMCINSQAIQIREDGIAIDFPTADGSRNWVDVHYPSELDRFAKRDGLEDFEEMKAFFRETYGLPFEGVLVQWVMPPLRA